MNKLFTDRVLDFIMLTSQVLCDKLDRLVDIAKGLAYNPLPPKVHYPIESDCGRLLIHEIGKIELNLGNECVQDKIREHMRSIKDL